jgi:hypothetical protein
MPWDSIRKPGENCLFRQYCRFVQGSFSVDSGSVAYAGDEPWEGRLRDAVQLSHHQEKQGDEP